MSIEKNKKVKILKEESFWFNGIGTVISVDDPELKTKYPVSVRFESANYSNNFVGTFDLKDVISTS